MTYRRTRGPRLTDSWLIPFVVTSVGSVAFAVFLSVELFRGLFSLTEVESEWGLLAVALLSSICAIITGRIVVGRLRNTVPGKPVLILDDEGLATPDVFGRMRSFAWKDVLGFDLDHQAKSSQPTLLLRTKRSGIGSIELWDTDAHPEVVVAQIEVLSGRNRG